jgi:hypothetical protein
VLPEPVSEDFEVWQENVDSLQWFHRLWSQWRHGFAGRTGLDYAVLPSMFELYEVPSERRRELFDDLQLMEDATLEWVAKEQEKARG